MKTITLKAPVLHALFAQAIAASATNDTRPTLNGIHVSIKEGYIECTGADGFWLIRSKHLLDTKPSREATNPLKMDPIILHREDVLEVLKLVPYKLTSDHEPAHLTVSKEGGLDVVAMDFGKHRYYMATISGAIPDFDSLIPTASTSINRSHFAANMRFMAALGKLSKFTESGIIRCFPGTEPGQPTLYKWRHDDHSVDALALIMPMFTQWD